MNWYPVESANLLRVGYDPVNKVLEVRFVARPDWIYSYQNVGLLKFARLLAAESVGSYFDRQIRSRRLLHPFTKRKVG
jgi:hypothetical protein